MAEDYTGIISLFLSITFLFYCIKSFFDGYSGKCKNKIEVSDNFDLGYVYNPRENILNDRILYLEKQISSLQEKSRKSNQKQKDTTTKRSYQKHEEQLPTKDDSLIEECILALQKLGYKTQDAKRAVDSFFRKNSVKTVNEFVLEFFKKPQK